MYKTAILLFDCFSAHAQGNNNNIKTHAKGCVHVWYSLFYTITVTKYNLSFMHIITVINK
jgi:hypothetical protein